MARRSPRTRRTRLAGALASALAVIATSCGDGPSGPRSYAGVEGTYTIQGGYQGYPAANARLSGRVTLRQPDPTSPALTGTASVTLYNGDTPVETFNEVFSAEREGEHGFRFSLVNNSRISGIWDFAGTVEGNRASGTQGLDYYVIPGTGSSTVISGTWSGTR